MCVCRNYLNTGGECIASLEEFRLMLALDLRVRAIKAQEWKEINNKAQQTEPWASTTLVLSILEVSGSVKGRLRKGERGGKVLACGSVRGMCGFMSQRGRRAIYLSLEALGLEVPSSSSCLLACLEQVLGGCCNIWNPHPFFPAPQHQAFVSFPASEAGWTPASKAQSYLTLL